MIKQNIWSNQSPCRTVTAPSSCRANLLLHSPFLGQPEKLVLLFNSSAFFLSLICNSHRLNQFTNFVSKSNEFHAVCNLAMKQRSLFKFYLSNLHVRDSLRYRAQSRFWFKPSSLLRTQIFCWFQISCFSSEHEDVYKYSKDVRTSGRQWTYNGWSCRVPATSSWRREKTFQSLLAQMEYLPARCLSFLFLKF